MNSNIPISKLGEIEIIKIIEDVIFKKSKKKLIRDDSFFFSLEKKSKYEDNINTTLILNSDMLVSTTDIPPQMSYYQIGRKAVLMNISDLIVKGVKPEGIVISLGLLKEMKLYDLKDLLEGIVEYCIKWNMDYIGGDLNETKELIINPTVFGVQNNTKIIYRGGFKQGDYLIANGRFGLTGVGFDILLNEKNDLKLYSAYRECIESVLEPTDIGLEAFILSENNLATSSIDSSDGLAKSLADLMSSNQNKNLGFEIEFTEEFIDEKAILYSQEFNSSLEDLVFNGGEEFIHLFTIDPKNYDSAIKTIKANGGNAFKIGKVNSEGKIYILKDGKKNELKSSGFEHFRMNS